MSEKFGQRAGQGGPSWDGTFATWRADLLTYGRRSIAAIGLLSSLVWLATGGGGWLVPLALAVVGGLALALPRLSLSLRQQSICLVGASLALLGVLAISGGWSPAYVSIFSVVVLVAGFVLGVRAAMLAVLLSACWFVAGGFALRAGVLTVDTAHVDPGDPDNWVRATIVMAISATLSFLLVRRAAALVGASYARAQEGLLEEERRREKARLAREARIAAVDSLRTHQKIQLVGRLSAGLAHWFNNALTVVRGATEGLTPATDLAARRQASTTVQRAIERGAAALKELMVFSRSDDLALAPLELGETIGEAEATLRNAVGADTSLEFRLSAGLHVRADATRLRQLVLNLVLNANDATGDGQRIRVSVGLEEPDRASPHGYALLAVEDQGHGMEPEVVAQAIEPFFTTRLTGDHTGLGLSAAAAIVEQFGGTLEVASAPGAGTRVMVLLPLEREPDRERATASDDVLLLPDDAFEDTARSGVWLTSPHAIVSQSATPSVPEWKAEMLRRLAYATSAFFVLAGGFTLVVAPLTRPALVPMMPVFVGVPALAGALRRAPHALRQWFLQVPIAALAAYMVHLYSFQAPAPLFMLLVVVAWATLLGSDTAGVVAVIWAVVAVGFAAVLHTDSYVPIASIAEPSNWFRIGALLVFPAAALAVSVSAVLRHARNGAAILRKAAARTRALAREEAHEDRQLQIAEKRSERAAKLGVAGQAVGTIAHDVRNALQALHYWSDELTEENQSEADVEETLRNLGSAIDYAEALASQFSLAEAGVTAPGRPVDLTKVVGRTVELLRALIPSDIELTDEVEPGCAVRVGENDVRRLLFNLITNARDAMSSGGAIRVALKRVGDRVELSVSDTGSGMDENTRSRVFDAFFTTKERGHGTGLGLHTVASIARATRGTVELESTLGEGTTVLLSWPGARAPAPAAQLPTPSRLHESLGTVLVAEDEEVVREMLSTVLTRAGYRVQCAADGDQALELVRAPVEYAAMCIDGVMPGCRTSDVVDAFMVSHPGRPVLICSGYLPDELTRRGLNRPGVSFLPKPFGPARLREQLAIAIGGHGATSDAANQAD